MASILPCRGISTAHPRADPGSLPHISGSGEYAGAQQSDLTFRIAGWYDGRKSWADGKTQRLEEKLPQVIEGFLAAAEAMKRKTEEQAEQHRKWAEEAEIRRQKEIAERKEREFLEAALKEANTWQQANQLRQYVQHLRETIAANKIELTEYGQEWLRHADKSAELLDPTRKWLGDP